MPGGQPCCKIVPGQPFCGMRCSEDVLQSPKEKLHIACVNDERVSPCDDVFDEYQVSRAAASYPDYIYFYK